MMWVSTGEAIHFQAGTQTLTSNFSFINPPLLPSPCCRLIDDLQVRRSKRFVKSCPCILNMSGSTCILLSEMEATTLICVGEYLKYILEDAGLQYDPTFQQDSYYRHVYCI